MRTVFDFSPYRRSTVGFDRLFDTLEAAARGEGTGTNYPPYDIEKTGDDAYRITLAVAGFKPEDLDLTAQQNLLTIKGRKQDDSDTDYLHVGIANRGFERRFELADYVRVDDAKLADYIHHNAFNTIVGEIRFEQKGEWATPRLLMIQYQNIKGGGLDQYRVPGTQVILYPPQYRNGELQHPFAK